MRPNLIALLAAASLAVSGAAFAAGGGGGQDTPVTPKVADPNFIRAKAMVEAGDYKGAIPLLHQVVAREGRHADAYNLLGFSTRKLGDAQGSLQFYQQALALDAKHLGAHEYIGEAYLMLGRVQDAEQHLARLDSICVFGCTEYRMLKTAIANYKAGKKPTN
jgi:Flp pilus assembly protein TadD